MLKLIKIFFIFLLPFIYSCSASKTETADLKNIPVSKLKEKLNNSSKYIQTFEASGSISVETPEESNSGYFELRIKKPDSLFIKIEGPFGISIASALITSKDFIYYNSQENKAITGPTNDINIGSVLKIKMGFNELINALTGTFSFAEESGDTLEAGTEKSNYLIATNLKSGISRYLIEPDLFLINEYSVFDNANKKILDVTYPKYDNYGSVYLPEQLIIKKPDTKQTIWLNYSSKDINKKDLSFKIKVPKSAKVIKWE